MPRKNSRKTYVEGGCYHLYNRGVEKRQIFLDDQDYGVFLSYLRESLMAKDKKALEKDLADPRRSSADKIRIGQEIRLANFADEIDLIAYCLMPNHFHLLVKQRQSNSIDRFMKSIGTRYAMYFNKRYQRVGTLYQGVYRAVLVADDAQFLHLTRYIHQQASAAAQPSSFPEYLGQRRTTWVHPDDVLVFFSDKVPSLSYEAFVESYQPEDRSPLGDLTLEP